jgi:dipeptidyl aminopeptidase/acylaminoacyl peptidase
MGKIRATSKPFHAQSRALYCNGALALLAAAPLHAAEPTAPAPAATPATTPAALSAKPALIPTDIIAEQPFISRPKLAPDGKHLVSRAHVKEVEGLALSSFTGEPPQFIPFAVSKDSFKLRWYRWAGNSTILISVGKTVPWDGDDALNTRLGAYDIITKKFRFIGEESEGLIGDDILWVDPEGKSVLMAYQPTIYEYPEVYRVDLATNKRKLAVRAITDVWEWYADNAGVVRFGVRHNGGGKWDLLYRPKDGDPFKTVVRAKDAEDEDASLSSARIFNGSDEGYRIMKNEKSGKDALYKFNFSTRERGDLVYEVAGYDIDDYEVNDVTGELLSAWYTDDQQRVHWFKKDQAELQESLDKAVGARRAWVMTTSRDEQVMMVHVGSASDLGTYYYFDKADGNMNRYATLNAKLSSQTLAAPRFVSYKARDGLEIPAYLTLPVGRDPKNLPLVILPHGGPYYVRDDSSFDDDVQFLANRGYVVLQPQYRGSSGFGEDFYQKGRGQWGRKMQDDLDDGMDWLAKAGTIDPKRVCIVGISYGGYAAQWGAIRNPERYRCAASFAGVSDVGTQLKYQLRNMIEFKRGRAEWQETVTGPAGFDLKTISPLYNLDKLKVPLLLLHGDKDERVPIKQTRMLADALKAAGKIAGQDYEYIAIAGEGHGYTNSASEKLWLDKLDAFLKMHNPAD